MPRYRDPSIFGLLAIPAAGLLCFGLLIYAWMAWMPVYNVWKKEMAGRAALAQADQDRQISIAEAKAKKESAEFLAEAELARAKGSAEANRTLSQSLTGPGADNYLRLRYIMMLEDNRNVNREIIYIPQSSDSSLPITEAGRATIPTR